MIIDKELQKVAPPLAENEYRLLAADILEHGCKTPLIVWNGMLVDGFTRLEICEKNGIPFTIEEIDLADRRAAFLWRMETHIARRNLNAFQRCEMILPFEEELKVEAERRRRAGISLARRGLKNTHGPQRNTRDTLSEMAGVSHGTFLQVKKICKLGDWRLFEKLRLGEISINKAYCMVTERRTSRPLNKPTTRLEDAAFLASSLTEEVKAGKADHGFIVEVLEEITDIIAEEIRNGKRHV